MLAKRSVDSRGFWDAMAVQDPAWYVATGSDGIDEELYARGAEETDHYLAFCGITLDTTDTVVEIGCGIGRMTRRLSELAGRVVATDVSSEMLARCQLALADRRNVDYLQLPGDGMLADIPDGSTDAVFSYITLQHIPTAEAQLRYLAESVRILRPGGRAAIQVRSPGWRARTYDWTGHLAHFATGRRTLRPEWRGTRLAATDIQRTLHAAGAWLQLRPHNRRHTWVIAAPPGQPASRPRQPIG